MLKNWEILPDISENISKGKFNFEPVVWRLIANRGFFSESEIKKFLDMENEAEIYEPRLFKDMAPAVETIIRHIKSKNKIIVYGDYDADGVTASVILVEILTTLKAEVEVYIPERISEGYGLNNKSIDTIAENGFKLIITVDCGIRNYKEVEYAQSKGLEVIITDHHVPPENKSELPGCYVIDPLLPDEKYPFKFLSGAGIALKLGQAILDSSKLNGEQKEIIQKRALDILAIGTVADCVSLLGENRKLVKLGLAALNRTKRSGLLELANCARIGNGKKLDTWNISFQIAPRLNAAGRMEHANTAYQLLITKDSVEAKKLACKLNDNNIARQKNTDEIMLKAEKQYNPDGGDKIFIGVCDIDEDKEEEVWNEGVIGLVAGKICEKYYLPALVITKTKAGYKGSGRSIPEFNLIKAIEESAEFLDKFGGHAAACGFSFKKENLENFTRKIKSLASQKLAAVDLAPKLVIDAVIAFADINEKLVGELALFEPFGQSNEKPKFASYGGLILDIFNMGAEGQHLKLKIKGGQAKIFNALGFGQTEKWRDLRIGDTIDIVYYIEINEFNGRSEVQLKIVDIKKQDN